MYNEIEREPSAVKRGQIWFADLGDSSGCEQSGARPVLILQNDKGNFFSPTTIVAGITTKIAKKPLPTHVYVGKDGGLVRESMVLLEQIRTLDKKRLLNYIGEISEETMWRVERALCISLGLATAE